MLEERIAATMTPGPPVPATPRAARVEALDALRGLAALVVVLHHEHLILKSAYPFLEGTFMRTPLRLLVAGRASVLLFFILSGYVLNSSLKARTPYVGFVVKRFFRIMLPYTVAIGLSAAMCLAIAPAPNPVLSDWFNEKVWAHPVTGGTLLRHLAMVGLGDESLNNAAWSLVYELRISLLMPALAWLGRRSGLASAAGAAALFAVTYAALTALKIDRYYGKTLADGLVITVYYVPFFVVGVLLNNSAARLGQFVAARPAWQAVAAALGGLVLCATERDVLMGVGATALIALSAWHPLFVRWLSLSPLRWLGRVSYSLYLIHIPVIAALFHLLFARLSLPAIAALGIPASLVAAQLLYSAVEVPSMSIGRALSARTVKAKAT